MELKGLDLIHAWFDLPENDHRIPKDVWAALEETFNKIKELEANQPKWVSVKDRLPDADRMVLVSNDGHVDTDVYLGSGFFCCCAKVSHWMLLPPPPTEESTASKRTDT